MGRVFFAVLISMLSLSERAQALTFDKGVPAATQQQITLDLDFMRSLVGAGATPLHAQVYGAFEGARYSSWFLSRVLKVGYDPNSSSGAVAYVAPFFDSTRMVLTGNFTRFSHPQIARLMIVYHEARHTEGASSFWPHATCPRPFLDDNGNEIKSIWTGLPLAGEAACDNSSIGAYGSTVVLLANMSRFCGNCSEKVKMDADLYAHDQYKRVTNVNAKAALKQDLSW